MEMAVELNVGKGGQAAKRGTGTSPKKEECFDSRPTIEMASLNIPGHIVTTSAILPLQDIGIVGLHHTYILLQGAILVHISFIITIRLLGCRGARLIRSAHCIELHKPT